MLSFVNSGDWRMGLVEGRGTLKGSNVYFTVDISFTLSAIALLIYDSLKKSTSFKSLCIYTAGCRNWDVLL